MSKLNEYSQFIPEIKKEISRLKRIKIFLFFVMLSLLGFAIKTPSTTALAIIAFIGIILVIWYWIVDDKLGIEKRTLENATAPTRPTTAEQRKLNNPD